ncbi:MAG: histidinol-phosphate transaminase [Deltaproteobacteria bacterium]
MKPEIPARILGLEPYQPGKPIEEVERELGIEGSIKLASNENPLGPSPAALVALAGASADLHRYPDGGAVRLTRKLADRLEVAPEQVILGNGSNEIIELLVRVFAGPGDEVVMSADAFLIYDLVTRAAGASSVRVEPKGYSHDLDAIGTAIGPSTRVVFLANPNNPTGTTFGLAEWEDFLGGVPAGVVVAVDEAYAEYVDDPDYPDSLSYLDSHPGLLVMRTFSKIYGLAGLRIGYGVTSIEIASALQRLRQPFNVGSLAQEAALAALDDHAHLEASRQLAAEGRRYYAQNFERLGLEYVPSQANFVLVEVGDGDRVSSELLGLGVIVRPMQAYGMASKIRITFGTQSENRRCIEALADVTGRGG